jgi:hypothetical protein
MSGFTEHDQNFLFASYWGRIIGAVANKHISVGAVIAAALSLDLVVEPDWAHGLLESGSGWDGIIRHEGKAMQLNQDIVF